MMATHLFAPTHRLLYDDFVSCFIELVRGGALTRESGVPMSTIKVGSVRQFTRDEMETSSHDFEVSLFKALCKNGSKASNT